MAFHPDPVFSTDWPRRGIAAAASTALLILAAFAAEPLPAQEAEHAHPRLGEVDFQVSCAPVVRADFDRAVALLHHMTYEQARARFEEIARRDPDCAMAHWGIAMTLFQPLWPARPGPDVRRRGWEAARRAAELGPPTERERALVAAVEAFYRDPDADAWWPRIRRWHEAMREAHRARPDDPETGAFYALSEVAVGAQADDPLAHNETAAGILARIHARAPEHPGAIHYTIHANDVAGREGESLDVVRRYEAIAPGVPHALHMPTHIFVRLGEWPEVIEWNRRSADAALRHPAGDRISLHYSHALDYLLYSHLQRGEDARAEAVLNEVRSRSPHQEDFASAFHLAMMPARYAVERRAWTEAAGLRPRTPDYLAWDRYAWAEASSWFARGLGAAHTGEPGGAREAEARMRVLRDGARSAGEEGFATYIEIDRLILAGVLAHAEGDAETAVERMREAAALEATIQKHPITPGALLPPYEALGDLLAELGRPEEARRAYERSLEVWPRRYNSLLGAARAATAAGDARGAAAHYRELLAVTDGARTDRAGVGEARAFLAERS
jgi:tetratricopeptide (TPR) repeat protein